MAYTAKKVGTNYEIYQDGNRISTGSASSLVNYGLSESNLGGSAPAPAPAPAPTPTTPTVTAPTTQPTQQATAPANLNNTEYYKWLAEQEAIRKENERKAKIVADATALKSSGAGSTQLSSYVNNLAEADRGLVTGIFGTNASVATSGQSYVVKSGDTIGAIAKQFGVPISDITGYKSGNANLIYPGETLTIGKKTTTSTPTSTTPTNNNTSIASQLDSAKTEALRIQEEIKNINSTANTDQSSTYMTIKDSMGNKVDESDSTKIIKALISSFEANNSQPTAPSLSEQFNQERAKLGVGTLETNLSSIDAEIAKLDNDFLNQGEDTTNRQTSVTQINRRKSAEQIGYERTRAELQLKRTGVVNELNQKYSVIDSIMKYAGADYDNAQQDYNTKFTQAVNLINLIKGVEDDQKTEIEAKTDNARANLQIVLNQVKGKDFNTLDAGTQADIRALEMQAGLPSGFTKFLASSVDQPVVSIGSEFTDASGNRQVPIYTKNEATGVVTAKVITLGTSSSGGETQGEKTKAEADDIASAILDFQQQIKTKGWLGINPDAYAYYKAEILKQYGASAVLKFDKAIADAGLAVDNR